MPLPPGFQLEQDPRLPPGFVLESSQQQIEPEQPQGRSALQNFGRQLALTGRAGLSGVGLGGAANLMGLPQPENATERVVQDIAGTMVGGGAIGAGAKALARGAQGLAQPILNTLGANPGMQAAASAGAGAGSGIAREEGYGPVGQTVAGLGGGFAGGLAVPYGRSAAHWAREHLYPTPGNLGVRAAGDKSRDVIAALRTEESEVPGVKLHSGQASVPTNSAEFAAFQNKLSTIKDAPSEYAGPLGIEGQQRAARLAALRDEIAKTPKDLDIAVTNRTNISNRNYGLAFKQTVRGDPELEKLASNPYFKDELQDALKLAQANGLNPKTDLTKFLHYVKEGLDARLLTLEKPDAPAVSKDMKRAIIGVKTDLVSWLEKKNPMYDAARIRHASLSQPINQMKFGQELERAMIAPATEAERPAAFANAVRKAETTRSKATGRERIYDITPRQRALVDAIESDYKRDAIYKDLARAGSESLEQRIGDPEIRSFGIFNPFLSFARGRINQMLGTGLEKGLEHASVISRNPQAMASAMEAELMKQAPNLRTASERAAYRAAVAAALMELQ